jgi:hypothetical protein
MRQVILLAFLVVAFSSPVMAQTDYCQVTTAWVDQKTHFSSSIDNVGHYCIDPNPDDSPSNRTFAHEESGIKVRVAVDYYKHFLEKKTITTIRIWMSLDDEQGTKENGSNQRDVSLSMNSVHAETIRDKHWKILILSKKISTDGKDYTFWLHCSRQTKQTSKIFKCDSETPNNRVNRSARSGFLMVPLSMARAPDYAER